MVMQRNVLEAFVEAGRVTVQAVRQDDRLGPMGDLPGTWSNAPRAAGLPDFSGHGWNLIALPHAASPTSFMLMANQYDEELRFGPDLTGPVMNRGVPRDQSIFALEYRQRITQRAAAVHPQPADPLDPPTGSGPGIHLEPGFLLHVASEVDPHFDVARLGSIPHGDGVLAVGSAKSEAGPPDLAAALATSGLPIGSVTNLDDRYLEPYKFLDANRLKGIFTPLLPAALLEGVIDPASVVRTTTLDFDTANPTSAIANLPFVTSQANATTLRSIFWIQELAPVGVQPPVFVLQYLQVVMLQFFARTDGRPGLIHWPHVSINTLVRNP